MSLTSHLKSADSAVRIFLEGVSPLVGQAKGPSRRARVAAENLGLDRAASLERFVTMPADVDTIHWSSPIGTAFDYRARMMLGDFDLDTSVAVAGPSTLPPGTHEFEVFGEALEVARQLLQEDDPTDHDRGAIVLAWCESLARSPYALLGSLGNAASAAPDGASLVRAIPQPVLDDLQQLRGVGGSLQIEAWRSTIQGGARYEPNPVFSGGEVVGGADGDWMIGDTLVDCKTTSKLNRSILRTHLLQLLGYVLLDENDDLGIRQVAIWLPRYGETFTWSLAELLEADPHKALPPLREDFIRVVRNSAHGVALHGEPITEKRAKGLIAENKHAPIESLDDLGSSAELAVRVKVADNANTPAHTLFRLAGDRNVEVRLGVAGNHNTPWDALERLKNDRSERVRDTAELTLDDQRSITARAETSETSRRSSAALAAAARRRKRKRIRNRNRFDRRVLHLFENTELADYWDYRDELTLNRWLFDSTTIRPYRQSDDGYTAERERLFRESDPERWELEERLEQFRLEQSRPALETLSEQSSDGVVVKSQLPSARDIQLRASLERPPSQGDVLLAASRDTSLSGFERSRALDRLSRLSSEFCRADAARSPRADMQMLLRLSMDKRAEVRSAVAGNEKTPVTILEFLSGGRTVSVRRAVARNKNLSERALQSLSVDTDEDVRSRVADHGSTPADVLATLTDSDSLLVSLFAVLNPNTPIDTVRSMQDDPDPVVRKVVAATLVYRESAGDEVSKALV